VGLRPALTGYVGNFSGGVKFFRTAAETYEVDTW